MQAFFLFFCLDIFSYLEVIENSRHSGRMNVRLLCREGLFMSLEYDRAQSRQADGNWAWGL